MTNLEKVGDIIDGEVIAFDAHIGLGQVKSARVDSESYPFHCVNIADGSRNIDVGAKVRAEIYMHPRGRLELKNIHKL